MTQSEFACMMAIWSYWWSYEIKPWPCIETLARHLAKSTRQVKRYIASLKEKGFLRVEERYVEEGRQTTNCYDFTPFLQRFLQMEEEMEQLAKPLHVVGEGDTFDMGRVTSVSWSRGTRMAPKVDEEEKDTLELGVSRSDSVASEGQLIKNKNKNVDQATEKESGADQVKGVYELETLRRSKRKRHARGATPPPLPTTLLQLLQPLSLFFCDQACKASATSLAWLYAQVQQRGMQESQFYYFLYEARDITIAMTADNRITARNKDGSIAQMRYFLSVLESQIDDWCKRHDEEAQQESVLPPVEDGAREQGSHEQVEETGYQLGETVMVPKAEGESQLGAATGINVPSQQQGSVE